MDINEILKTFLLYNHTHLEKGQFSGTAYISSHALLLQLTGFRSLQPISSFTLIRNIVLQITRILSIFFVRMKDQTIRTEGPLALTILTSPIFVTLIRIREQKTVFRQFCVGRTSEKKESILAFLCFIAATC